MKHYQQSHNDAMHQLTKQDNRLLWHRHGLCYLRFFLISLLVVFLMSPVSAQDFKLFYANNVTDVTDFDKITEPNSGLDWRQVTDTDMDGNQAEVYAVHQMLAGFVSEERCSVDLTLRPGSWDDEEMVVSSHRFLYLYDERQVVVRNKEDYRLCSILEQEQHFGMGWPRFRR